VWYRFELVGDVFEPKKFPQTCNQNTPKKAQNKFETFVENFFSKFEEKSKNKTTQLLLFFFKKKQKSWKEKQIEVTIYCIRQNNV
jgi:hypothetical protein